jgi:hypothetical protein
LACPSVSPQFKLMVFWLTLPPAATLHGDAVV